MAEQVTQRYFIPAADWSNPHCTQEVIRRSRFLAQSCQCASRRQAMRFVDSVRAAHLDATHNCWAYVAGAPADTAQVGSSDDGEPHGTAGRPMLNALLHSGIGQVCVVVSRWFGGVKLGTGGLVRAYQDAVQKNIASLPLVEAVRRQLWQITCPYATLAAVKYSLVRLQANIENEEFGGQVTLLASVPTAHSDDLLQQVANASSGAAVLMALPECS